MKGIQSIKVHRGFELASTNHIIRWTEVFIIQVIAKFDLLFYLSLKRVVKILRIVSLRQIFIHIIEKLCLE